MRYIINRNETVSSYMQLYRQLREDIVQEIYPYGSKLPSKRLLAEETGVSTVTAEHAYSLLCDEGYIRPRERSGYYVIFRKSDGFALPSGENRAQIKAFGNSEGSSPDFPFSNLAKTMRAVINDYGEGILERSPSKGRGELRESISRYLGRSRGIAADPEQIIIGSGSEYLYRVIVELLGRRTSYAIESPSYNKIEQIYRSCGVELDMLPLGGDGVQSKALWQTKAGVLHITPYRSFPSGVTASASKRHEYLRWSDRSGKYIVEDDFESEFTVSMKPEETLFSNAKRENIIYMNTFSKTISPSVRVGYAVLPQHLTETYNEELGFYSCTVPTYNQLVLAELISNGDFERHINRVRRKKRSESNI